jgi:hypothetical protein
MEQKQLSYRVAELIQPTAWKFELILHWYGLLAFASLRESATGYFPITLPLLHSPTARDPERACAPFL